MRGDKRQCRRGDAFDAPGLTQTDRADGDELLLDFVGEAREAPIVEVGRQDSRIVAAVASDVLGLAVEINKVFRVRFEPANKRSGNVAKLRPDARKNIERKLGLRRQFEGRAAGAVAIDKKAVRLELPRRGGRAVEHRAGLLELVSDMGVGARSL